MRIPRRPRRPTPYHLLARLLRPLRGDELSRLVDGQSIEELGALGCGELEQRYRRTFPCDRQAREVAALMERAATHRCNACVPVCACRDLRAEVRARAVPFARTLSHTDDPFYRRLGQLMAGALGRT